MTGTTVTASPPGSRRRRILIVTCVALLLLLLARTGVDIWASRRIDAVIAGLENKYGSLDERTLSVSPVPQVENRARAIRAAAALTVLAPGKRYWDLASAVNRFIAAPASTPVPSDLAAFVEGNRAAIRVADEARARRQSNWEADYAWGHNNPPWMDIRTLVNAIILAARLDLHAGRPDDAAREIASGLAVSASVRQEPDMLAQIFRCALGIQQYEAVQQLVIQSEPSKSSLEELAMWLAENRSPDPMQLGLLSELKRSNPFLIRAENGDMARMTFLSDSPFWLGPLARLGRPVMRLARLRYLRNMEQLLDAQSGPRPRAAVPVAPAGWTWLKRLDNTSIEGLDRAVDSGDLFNSELALSELAIALRRFRIDHGQYPDALSALVPVYVSSVRIDSFTGQPPVYARQGAGFRLHADAGKPFPATDTAALDWIVVK